MCQFVAETVSPYSGSGIGSLCRFIYRWASLRVIVCCGFSEHNAVWAWASYWQSVRVLCDRAYYIGAHLQDYDMEGEVLGGPREGVFPLHHGSRGAMKHRRAIRNNVATQRLETPLSRCATTIIIHVVAAVGWSCG